MYIKLYYQKVEDNFGDILSREIVRHLSCYEVRWSSLKRADMVALGSLGERVALKKLKRYFLHFGRSLDVWGTGFLAPGATVSQRFVNIHALRGEYSRQRFGIDKTIALGDPGLLTPLVYKHRVESTGTILCLPHLHDQYAHQWVEEIRKLYPNKPVETLRLSASAEAVTTAIATAECVVSTAMHPLIVAQSYGVPSVWLEAETALHPGARYKFEDYFSVFGRVPHAVPLAQLLQSDLSDSAFKRAMDSSIFPDSQVKTLQQDLIAAFPGCYR